MHSNEGDEFWRVVVRDPERILQESVFGFSRARAHMREHEKLVHVSMGSYSGWMVGIEIALSVDYEGAVQVVGPKDSIAQLKLRYSKEEFTAHVMVQGDPSEATVFPLYLSARETRSRGILEPRALASKRVAFIGIGSGASPIAVELAKAGVGHFDLLDKDILEPGNIHRHVCGINDVGRYKTLAVADIIKNINSDANIHTYEVDANVDIRKLHSLVERADLTICGADNNRTRLNINRAALDGNRPAIFGRALTRAHAGDVLRVRPFSGPCFACIFAGALPDDEEISDAAVLQAQLPAYVSRSAIETRVQVGLSSDILPISLLMTKLAIFELTRNTEHELPGLAEDFEADYYLWANRREGSFIELSPIGFDCNRPSILRVMPVKARRRSDCPFCGMSAAQDDDVGPVVHEKPR